MDALDNPNQFEPLTPVLERQNSLQPITSQIRFTHTHDCSRSILSMHKAYGQTAMVDALLPVLWRGGPSVDPRLWVFQRVGDHPRPKNHVACTMSLFFATHRKSTPEFLIKHIGNANPIP